MAEITSRPYHPAQCCERCVFGSGEHAEWCESCGDWTEEWDITDLVPREAYLVTHQDLVCSHEWVTCADNLNDVYCKRCFAQQ